MQIALIRTVSSQKHVPYLDSSASLACSKSRRGGPASLHGRCTRPVRPLRGTGAGAVLWLQGAWQSRCEGCPHLLLKVLSTHFLFSLQYDCAPPHMGTSEAHRLSHSDSSLLAAWLAIADPGLESKSPRKWIGACCRGTYQFRRMGLL